MTVPQYVLELLRVLLQWPPVVAVLVAVLLKTFKNDIRELLKRRVRLRRGDTEIDVQPQETLPSVENPPSLPEPAGASTHLVPEGIHLTPEAATAVENVIRSQQAEARTWEFRFLNAFLVRHTQEILDWFVNAPQPVTIGSFEATWVERVSPATERQAVLSALENYDLIRRNGDFFNVTQKARDYIAWRGALTPPQPPRTGE